MVMHKVAMGDVVSTDSAGYLRFGAIHQEAPTCGEDTRPRGLGSDLWCYWVKWPGGGERPWPIGAYLGTSPENGRRMWQTISPYSRVPLRMHIPDGAEVVAGPYTLSGTHFPPVKPGDIGAGMQCGGGT